MARSTFSVQRVVAPVDPFERLVIDRLDAIFDPDLVLFREFHEILERLFGHAVAAGSNAEAHDSFVTQCFVVKRFQRFEGSVGIGECLEVDQKAVDAVSISKKGGGIFHLLVELLQLLL